MRAVIRRPQSESYIILEKAKKTPSKKVLIWDCDYGTELAARFAKDGHDTLYYTEWPESHSHFNKFAVGLGMDGIKKIKHFFKYYKDVDYIIFMETGRGDLCNDLRKEKIANPDSSLPYIFGAGLGEKLELKRAWAKEIQKQVGLPVAPYKIIKGVEGVINYLKKNPGKWIKQDIFRGDKETFYAEDEYGARTELNYLRPKIGPFEETYEFIVEDPVKDAVEAGWDLFFNGNDFLKPYLWGYCQDWFYVGKFTDKMPPVLEDVAVRIKPILQELNYRGIISIECQVVKDGTGFVTDWTTRFPLPLGFAYEYGLKNFSDVMFAVAEGKDIELDIKNKYIGYMEVQSMDVQDSWLKVTFPEKYKDNIKLRKPTKVEGNYYAIPTIDEVLCAVVDSNSNMKNMFERICDIGTQIKASGCDAGQASDAYGIYEEIKKGKKRGLDF